MAEHGASKFSVLFRRTFYDTWIHMLVMFNTEINKTDVRLCIKLSFSIFKAIVDSILKWR